MSAALDFDPYADEKDSNVTEGPWDNTASSNTEVVVTLKGGSGYDEPWVVIHADDIEGAAAVLDDEDALNSLLDAARKAADRFHGSAKPKAANTGAAASRTSAPGGATKSCKHGEMTFRSGAKNGKAWSGYFCPTPQGTADQCRPEFNK